MDESLVARPPEYPERWSSEGRVLVRVSGALEASQSWQVGDRLTLPLPQRGANYRPLIEEIDEGPGYARSALGWITELEGPPRRFVVTVGRTSVFAFIDMPDGPYELLADQNWGWLLPSTSMMAGVDFSKPDQVPLDDGPAAGVGPINGDGADGNF